MSKLSIKQRFDQGLHTFGGRLQTPEGRGQIVKGCLGLMRRLLRWTVIMFVGALLLLGVLLRVVGEQNVFFAFSSFMPPLIWFLPILGLLPLCVLLFEWRGLIIGIAGGAAAAAFLFGYEWRGQRDMAAREGQLVVLTNNRGQHGNYSMKDFKEAVKPDIMVFQEAGAVSARYLADPFYSEFKDGKDLGEFALVSRYPVLSVEPVTFVDDKGVTQNIAARYVIDFKGTHIVIYNTHMPSPRDALRYHVRGSFLYGLIGIPGTPLAAKRREVQRGWDLRISMVRFLMDLASKETMPTMMVGDFNLTSLGYCHGLLTDVFGDAHETAGSGFGFSFPGVTHNPLAMGQPWMRIDYLFFDRKHWQCTACITEPHRPSQHRAVAATFSLTTPAPSR